jgi:hypothetical protein
MQERTAGCAGPRRGKRVRGETDGVRSARLLVRAMCSTVALLEEGGTAAGDARRARDGVPSSGRRSSGDASAKSRRGRRPDVRRAALPRSPRLDALGSIRGWAGGSRRRLGWTAAPSGSPCRLVVKGVWQMHHRWRQHVLGQALAKERRSAGASGRDVATMYVTSRRSPCLYSTHVDGSRTAGWRGRRPPPHPLDAIAGILT